jgi:two-component system alkaline phosphatase synthesis response regulator PhoP
MAEKKKILIVEDERELAGLVSLHMRMAGFESLYATDGECALRTCRDVMPALVILDLMIPKVDGWEVCRCLRKEKDTKHIPIIILTARTELEDKLRGFEAGADDYMVKPFSPRELVARVKRVLGRCEREALSSGTRPARLIEFYLEESEVRVNGTVVRLTETENAIMHVLISREGALTTCDEILNKVWGKQEFVEYGNISVHIRHLREKLEKDPEHPVLIKTVRGQGYIYDAREETRKEAV